MSAKDHSEINHSSDFPLRHVGLGVSQTFFIYDSVDWWTPGWAIITTYHLYNYSYKQSKRRWMRTIRYFSLGLCHTFSTIDIAPELQCLSPARYRRLLRRETRY